MKVIPPSFILLGFRHVICHGHSSLFITRIYIQKAFYQSSKENNSNEKHVKITFYQISTYIDILLSKTFKLQTNKSFNQHKWTPGKDE